MLIQRGARINSTNRGDDTPLHLAAAHGHHEIVHLVSFQYFSFGFPTVIQIVTKNVNFT